MDTPEANTHSFTVRIWLEEADPTDWRGHITHVPSGNRRHFADLDDIAAFISQYLEAMGVRPRLGGRVRRWLQRRRRSIP